MGQSIGLKVCLAMAFFPAMGNAQELPPAKTVVYKKTQQCDLAMNVFFPVDWKAEQKCPALLFFFGGSWTTGSNEQFVHQAKYFAARGVVACCCEYRVKSRHGVAPDVCVEDAKSAVRWVRRNADLLGVDGEKIVAAGGSAGGHLAACTGLCPGNEAEGENGAISSRPNAMILYNPALDFTAPDLQRRVGDNAERAKSISPTLHLAKDSPPCLVLFGKTDPLLAQGEAFLARSKELGHKTEMFLADGVGHGFFNHEPWREKTSARVEEFLVAQGFLTAAGAGK